MKRRLHSPHHMERLRKFRRASLDQTFACRCSSRRVNQKKASWASSSSSSNNSKQSVCVNDEESSPMKKSQQVDLNAYLSKRRNTTGSISLTKIVDLKNTASGNTLKIAAHHSNQKISVESKANRSTFCRLFSFSSRYFPNYRRFRPLRDETIDSEQGKSRQFVRERMRLVEDVLFICLDRMNSIGIHWMWRWWWITFQWFNCWSNTALTRVQSVRSIDSFSRRIPSDWLFCLF